MKRADMIMAGAEQLFVTENAVDQALTEAGQLLSMLTRFRVGGSISAVVGQPAVDALLDAASSLGSARRSLVVAHNNLAQVKLQIGGRDVMVGTGQDKPLDDITLVPTESKPIPEAANHP